MKLEIAVIRGDGVGPELVDAACRVLGCACRRFGHELRLYPVRACSEALDFGDEALPDESLHVCQNVPAVLFGSSGLKRFRTEPPAKRPEAALLRLRKELRVGTNIRPVKIYPELAVFSPLNRELVEKGLNCVFVRDIAGGVLCSAQVRKRSIYGTEAYEYEYYNEMIVRESARVALKLASGRRKRLISLDKSNVLESSRLWRETVTAEAAVFPDIELSHEYVDNAAMRLIREPWKFDVIVTANIFGDILSDEGTQLTGTPCLYGSAEIGSSGHAIYTPNQLHFSDESAIGRRIVNPLGMIDAAALMLRLSFGLNEEAAFVERAAAKTIASGAATKDIWKEGSRLVSTDEMAESVCDYLENLKDC